MKFIARFYEGKWSGRRYSTGKHVKQKTFTADGWDEAEEIVYKIGEELRAIGGKYYDSSLTVIK